MSLKTQIVEDMKTAMKAKDTARLSAIRLALAAIKQKEVDERKELDDAAVVTVIEKMLKQRRESISQYQAAGRQDLVAAEQMELETLSIYMPQALSQAEVEAAVAEAIAASGAKGPADMGKAMGILKGKLAGRADMTQVSALLKQVLSRN